MSLPTYYYISSYYIELMGYLWVASPIISLSDDIEINPAPKSMR